MWEVFLTAQAVKDVPKLKNARLDSKAKALLAAMRDNPFQNPPPYEKLRGYAARYSRRINRQHRLVYEINAQAKEIVVLAMWTHYE